MECSEQKVRILGYVRLLTFATLTLRERTKDTKATKDSKLGMRQVLVALTLALTWASPAIGQIITEKFAVAAPDAIATPVKALLSADGVKVTAGAATLEFWWVSTLPVTGSGSASWSQVAEGVIVGAVRVNGTFKEIRGKTVKPGVYTLRYGLQPQNGDHLGASPFREYLLLSPAAADSDPKPLGFEGTVALSKQTVGASHPATLSLDPPVATPAVLSVVTNDLDHKGVVCEVKTSSGGSLRFGLILIGLIEH